MEQYRRQAQQQRQPDSRQPRNQPGGAAQQHKPTQTTWPDITACNRDDVSKRMTAAIFGDCVQQ
jgi:hypothetical protein